jgi:hypothetical protein
VGSKLGIVKRYPSEIIKQHLLRIKGDKLHQFLFYRCLAKAEVSIRSSSLSAIFAPNTLDLLHESGLEG